MLRYQIIPVTPLQQNCTIFWNEDTMQGAISDPGGNLDVIKKFIADNHIVLEKIVVTHGHLDHAAMVAALARELDIPIIGPHYDDKFLIDDLPKQAAQYGLECGGAFESDQWLVHGDKIEAAGVEFDVIHCPGHTPGHVVFYQPQDKIAIVGDVLFKGSIGRTDFPRGDHQQLITSITQRLWPLGEDVTFIPGHGPTSNFGFERKTNPFVSDMMVD